MKRAASVKSAVAAGLDRLLSRKHDESDDNSKSEKSLDFQAMEQRFKKLKDSYKDVVKLTKQYLQPHPGLRLEAAVMNKIDQLTQSNAGASASSSTSPSRLPIYILGDVFQSISKEIGTEAPLGQAFFKTGGAEKQLAQLWTDFEAKIQKDFISPLEIYLEEDMKEAQKVRRDTEKAKEEWEAQSQRVRKLARSLTVDTSSDHKLVQEKARLQDAEFKYRRLCFDFEVKFLSLAQDEQMADLISFIEHQMEYFRQSHEVLNNLRDTIVKVRKEERRRLLTAHATGLHVYALYDYAAKSADELSFIAGERLLILDQDTGYDGWWRAARLLEDQDDKMANNSLKRKFLHGPSGLVPSNFVAFDRVIARFDYSAPKNDGHALSFVKGDEIVVLNRDVGDVGWWQGALNGRIGFFPCSYVDLPVPTTCTKVESTIVPKIPENIPAAQQVDTNHSLVLDQLRRLNNELQRLQTTTVNALQVSAVDDGPLLSAAESLASSSKSWIHANKEDLNASIHCAKSFKQLVDSGFAVLNQIEKQSLKINLLGAIRDCGNTLSDVYREKLQYDGNNISSIAKETARTLGQLIDAILLLRKIERAPSPSSASLQTSPNLNQNRVTIMNMSKSQQMVNEARDSWHKTRRHSLADNITGEILAQTEQLFAYLVVRENELRKASVQSNAITPFYVQATAIALVAHEFAHVDFQNLTPGSLPKLAQSMDGSARSLVQTSRSLGGTNVNSHRFIVEIVTSLVAALTRFNQLKPEDLEETFNESEIYSPPSGITDEIADLLPSPPNDIADQLPSPPRTRDDQECLSEPDHRAQAAS